jgi:hypothetical protein
MVWCPKSRWSPPLCAFIALKIDKNGLEARKLRLLQSPKVGGVGFLKNSITACSVFLDPSTNP